MKRAAGDVVDLADPADAGGDLSRRLMAGEVCVVRGLLEHVGLEEDFAATTLRAIAGWRGDEVADAVRDRGFEFVHECVDAADVPALTDSVYGAMEAFAPGALRRIMRFLFPEVTDYYFEQEPNVRFHIPFDDAAGRRKQFDSYRSAGKISAHGPHRDSWLDCPVNGVNIWIAIGRVQHGNGMTVFTKDTDRPVRRQRGGEVDEHEKLSPPQHFDLAPGDAVLFRGDHVHGSELNRTDETRYVVSFRLTFDRPHFTGPHYHQYLHSRLAGGRLAPVAHVPAKLQVSYLRTKVRTVLGRLQARAVRGTADGAPTPARPVGAGRPPTARAMTTERRIALDELPVGAITPVSSSLCVARFDGDRLRAFNRFCPHSGGDLATGWIEGNSVVCPRHNLPFDADSRRSPCASLRPLIGYECSVVGDSVEIGPRIRVAGDEAGPVVPTDLPAVESTTTSAPPS